MAGGPHLLGRRGNNQTKAGLFGLGWRSGRDKRGYKGLNPKHLCLYLAFDKMRHYTHIKFKDFVFRYVC